jgi:hypothetical protein
MQEVMEIMECDSRGKETWDVKSSMHFETNKHIFKGVEACVQFPHVGLFTHKDLTWYANYRLGRSKIKWDVEVVHISLSRVQDFFFGKGQIMEANCKFTCR